MHKHFIHYIYIALGALLCSCSNEMVAECGGTLSAELLPKQPYAVVLGTRATSPGLQVDIVDSKGNVTHFNEDETNSKLRTLTLPADTYTLKAYSANYNTIYSDSELGNEKWYAETTFVIRNGAMTQVVLDVPMKNFGLCFQLPPGTEQWFTNPEFIAVYSNRIVTVPVGSTAYFDLNEGQNITYQISLSNSDNETFHGSGERESSLIEAGTVYTVSYIMANNAPQLFIK